MEKKEQDVLTVWVSNAVKYCKTHAMALGLAVLLIAVVWIGAACYLSHQEKVEQDSWMQYYQTQIALLTQGQEAATAIVNELVAKYPSSNAAYYAQLMLADLLFTQENYAQAVNTYQKLTDAKNPYVRTIATLSLAGAQQAIKDYASSIETAKKFIADNPTSFALPQAYFTLALSQELSGDKTAALETYKKILEDYTKTYFGVFAKDKITALTK